MNSNVTLTNSSQFYLANAEVFLRSIPTQIKFGELSDDALRLLVYYLSKAGPFAYEIAITNGFQGTVQDFLDSLKGEDGVDGLDGKAFAYEDFTPEQLEGLKGPKGEDGIDGVTQNATTITFTGLDTSDSSDVTETDTLLAVIGKLQAQLSALKLRVDSLEGTP